jgi:hypothetical protein
VLSAFVGSSENAAAGPANRMGVGVKEREFDIR